MTTLVTDTPAGRAAAAMLSGVRSVAPDEWDAAAGEGAFTAALFLPDAPALPPPGQATADDWRAHWAAAEHAVQAVRHALAGFSRQGVAGAVVLLAPPGDGPAQAAIAHLARIAAIEAGEQQPPCRVNSLHPAPGAGPAAIARAAAWLALPASRMVTGTAQPVAAEEATP